MKLTLIILLFISTLGFSQELIRVEKGAINIEFYTTPYGNTLIKLVKDSVAVKVENTYQVVNLVSDSPKTINHIDTCKYMNKNNWNLKWEVGDLDTIIEVVRFYNKNEKQL